MASNPVYIPVFRLLDSFLDFSVEQKQRTILRSDSGFGCDRNMDYALDEDWQVLSKGYAARRTGSLARRTTNAVWLDLGHQRWVTPVHDAPTFVRPVQYLLLRWQTEQAMFKHATVICSVLQWGMDEVITHYDDRGACETEIQANKGGLKICKRRKRSLAAQEALILLTDVAHNLLAWTHRWMQLHAKLAAFGIIRLTEDLLALPGRLIFDEKHHLLEVQLNELYPNVDQIADGLYKLLEYFGWP